MSSATSAISMRGAGYYSANTAGAKTVIDKAGDLVAEAIAALPVETGAGAFALADYGAADGGTSLDLMRGSSGWSGAGRRTGRSPSAIRTCRITTFRRCSA